MDKERILAARKKLKEFQRNKKDQIEKPQVERKLSQDESTKLAVVGRKENTFENVQHDCFNNGTEILNHENVSETANEVKPDEQSTALTNDKTLLNHSPVALNKEHLQMATAITDALNSKRVETLPVASVEEQKKLITKLQNQIGQYSNRVSELEGIVAGHEAQFEARLVSEVSPLQEQLQVQIHTTGILVAEKSELTAELAQIQVMCQQKAEEVAEFSSRLKASQHRVAELEKKIAAVKNGTNESLKDFQRVQQSYEEVAAKFSDLQKEKEDIEFEVAEIRQVLNKRNEEIEGLRQELQEKTSLLSLSELRVQQLTNSSQDLQSLESQHQTVQVMEQHVSQLKEAIKSLTIEKDETTKQYQSYVQQMDERYNKVSAELEMTRKLYAESQDREQSYIQRLSDMEQLLQRERERVVQPVEDQKEQIELLTKNIENLIVEQENFQKTIQTKDSEIESLKRDLQGLEDMREGTMQASKLATALQGEQLGASRAVAQNQQLKQQLNEMHDAFVLLSNTKLDLTEQLQAERTIGKKLNAQLNTVEQHVDELKDELSKKEVSLQELEKEKLVADQMQQFQAQSRNADTIEHELEKSLMTIENLKKEKLQLLATLEELKGKNVEETSMNGELDKVTDSNIIEPLETDDEERLKLLEPFKKLEVKFKDAMEKVAELSDDKQRLEHIVLQLQSETETIGEYVTLYQKQRAILLMKTTEREEMFSNLVEERNVQQAQLHKLKMLITDLLNVKYPTVSPATVADEHIPLTAEAGENADDKRLEVTEEQPCATEVIIDPKDTTTSQILDLLSDIKDCSNLHSLGPNFHHCPWCSGKLITV